MDDLDLLRDTPPDLDRVRGTELEREVGEVDESEDKTGIAA